MPTNPVVLINKGVPFKLYAIDPKVRVRDGARIGDDGEVEKFAIKEIEWDVLTNPQLDDAPVVVEEWLKLNNAALAALQTHYGSMDAFQVVSEARPNEAIAVAIAAMLGEDINDQAAVDKVSIRIVPNQMPNYQVSIMALMAIANGVDPTKAALMLDEGQKTAAKQILEMDKAMDEAVAEMQAENEEPEPDEAPSDTTSTSSSDSGSESGAPMSSSGS